MSFHKLRHIKPNKTFFIIKHITAYPVSPQRGHIQASQRRRNPLSPNNCRFTAMDRPRCEQQAFGCPMFNRFSTGLSHRRHKQGDSPSLRLLCHLPGLWYSVSIQIHDSPRALWFWLQQLNQITKQNRCPHFFFWKRIYPSLEWTYSNNFSNNELCNKTLWQNLSPLHEKLY